jgi:hypothetical protein
MIGAEVQAKVVATEQQEMTEVLAADKKAAQIVSTHGVAAAVEYLSNYSISTADGLVDKWVAFFPELFVKSVISPFSFFFFVFYVTIYFLDFVRCSCSV